MIKKEVLIVSVIYNYFVNKMLYISACFVRGGEDPMITNCTQYNGTWYNETCYTLASHGEEVYSWATEQVNTSSIAAVHDNNTVHNVTHSVTHNVTHKKSAADEYFQ